jgi:hypothetical protein
MPKLQTPAWSEMLPDDLIRRLRDECKRGEAKHGKLQSAHEVYAVLKGELEEFWLSVKAHDPDPQELLQICAVARRGILDLTEAARNGVIR